MTKYTLLLFPLILLSLALFGQQHSLRKPIPLGSPVICQSSTFDRLYGGSGADYASNLIPTSDSGYLLIGYTNSFGAGNFDGYAVRVDKLGNVQWSKTYGGTGDDQFNTACQTADGGYILAGYTTSYGDPADGWLVKIDAAGNLQWSKKYGDGNPYGERIFNIIQTADGGYAFCGDHKYIPGIVDAMLVRTDANGNLLWARGFDSGGSDECPGVLEDNDSLVVAAFYQTGTGYDATVMKIEETAGNIAWQKTWDFDSRTNRIGILFRQPDGYLITGVNSDGYGITNPYQNILKIDFNGNFVYDHELRTTPNTMNGAVFPTSDGGYVVENFNYSFNPATDIFMTKVAKDGTIDWAKTYPQPGQQSPASVLPAPDGGYAALAYSDQSGNSDLLFIKTDSTGTTNGCTTVSVTAVNRDPVVTNENYTWSSQYAIAFKPTLPVTPVVTDQSTVVSTLCQSLDYCVDLHLSGTDSICDPAKTVSYKAIRDSGCTSPVQWSVDNAYANIVSQTDSTIRLQFRQPGSVMLYGRIIGSCSIAQDSMPIMIFQPKPIFLGNDTTFCPGDSVLLNAGSGFQSYAWNTGDTASRIVASKGNIYSVAAVYPGSGCISKDTIAVSVYPQPVVNIGPDTTICRDSLYTFRAGGGFTTYTWQDGSSGPSFVAGQAGAYWVAVTDQDGCSASDTARILAVAENPKNFLDATSEICSEGQLPLQLNAIGTWRQYQWSDGSAGAATTIVAPGQYWLQVTNEAGCTARDTISVSAKECPLGIFFPNAFSPNHDGNNDVYRAIVYASLDKFYLAVFDRWGAKIFETTDPFIGWDGTFNGQLENAGTYVYFARYQVHGAKGSETVRKGTILLIR